MLAWYYNMKKGQIAFRARKFPNKWCVSSIKCNFIYQRNRTDLLILISDNVHSVGHISVRGSIFAREHRSRVFINFLCVRLGTIKLFKYCESILIVRWEWSSRHNPLSTKDPYLLVKGRVISWRRLASIPAIEITETGSRCSGEVNLQNNDGSVLGLLYLVTGNR